MTLRRHVELLYGSAPEALRGIEGDFLLLESPERSVAVRVWSCAETAVVLGVSRDPAIELDEVECARRSAAVIRRSSGGGTVVLGPGTLQYAFVLRHVADAAPAIDAVKRRCNEIVIAALRDCGVDTALDAEASGDICSADRKVGGLALRRLREATLLHGSLLLTADLTMISALLRHPAREPEWRRRRSHAEFLGQLGSLDAAAFERALRQHAIHD